MTSATTLCGRHPSQNPGGSSCAGHQGPPTCPPMSTTRFPTIAHRGRRAAACPPAALPANPTDIQAMLRGLVEAERCVVRGYTAICDVTAGKDHRTYDLACTRRSSTRPGSPSSSAKGQVVTHCESPGELTLYRQVPRRLGARHPGPREPAAARPARSSPVECSSEGAGGRAPLAVHRSSAAASPPPLPMATRRPLRRRTAVRQCHRALAAAPDHAGRVRPAGGYAGSGADVVARWVAPLQHLCRAGEVARYTTPTYARSPARRPQWPAR